MATPDPTRWTTALLEGLAGYLATAGVGAWRPDTAYAPDETAIVTGRLPDSPDRAVALAPYPVETSGLSHLTLGVQARCRGRAVDGLDGPTAIADAIHHAAHGATSLDLGGVPVAQIIVQSRAWIGADEAGRDEVTVNLYVLTAQPSAHVTD